MAFDSHHALAPIATTTLALTQTKPPPTTRAALFSGFGQLLAQSATAGVA